MGNVHAKKYALMPDVDLVAHDRDHSKLETFCGQHKAECLDELDALLDRSDLVDVCLPTDLHFEVAKQALQAGKHVIVEKPLARTVEQCQELLELSKSVGKHLIPAHVVRFFPEYANIHGIIKTEQLGRPASIRMRRGGKAPVGSDKWFSDYERSGGVLLDLALHEFDWLHWTLGEVESIYARSAQIGSHAHGQSLAGDYALAILEFKSGAIAHVEATWLDPSGFRTTVDAACSEGLIEYDSRKTASIITYTENGLRYEAALEPFDDPYYKQLRAAVDAAKGDAKPQVSAEDGLIAVAISLAALESAATDQPVKPASIS